MTEERCPRCDRAFAQALRRAETDANTDLESESDRVDECYSDPPGALDSRGRPMTPTAQYWSPACLERAVDWRARALKAEGYIKVGKEEAARLELNRVEVDKRTAGTFGLRAEQYGRASALAEGALRVISAIEAAAR